MSDYLEVLNRRTAAQSFLPASTISPQDLYSLVEDASLAPSSFNLQHCRFMAITTPEFKSKLANITLPTNRQKVMDASLCLLFVGDTLAHSDLGQRLDECVAADTLTREVADEWLGFVSNVYSSSNEMIRDEIIRSCSLAAMVFMLFRYEQGLRHLSDRLQPRRVNYSAETSREIHSRNDACLG